MPPRFLAITRCLCLLALVPFAGTLHAQQITITNPVASARVPIGAPCTIRWSSEGLSPETQLQITVTLDSVGSRQPVATFVPVAAGQYQWQIPWASQLGSNCSVKIALPGATTSWTGPSFALVSNLEPALLLHAPAGGEQWPAGATRSVAWEPHNLTGTLTLDLRQGSNVLNTVSGIPVVSNRFLYALPAQLTAGSGYTLRLTSDAAPSVTAVSPPFSVIQQVPAPRKWTMLFYFDAASFMQEEGTIQSFLDLGMMTPSTNINYVCEYARSPDYAITNYPWWGVKRYVMQHGITPTAAAALQDLGNVNMSDPNTLTDFINWAVENYPAQNYFLILSDHGNGWRDGLLLDEVNGHRWMSTRELQAALTNAESPMTILGLDMCVEGDIEVAHQLRHTGPQILIASQFLESTNWPYHTVFQQLQSKLETDSLTLEGLAALFCEGFVALHANPMATGTLAATRLRQMDALTAAVAGFADTMITNYTDPAAVRQQADAVVAAFNQAVFYCARTRVLEYQAYGLNLCFPMGPDPFIINAYDSRYVDFPTDSHWGAFLAAYYQNLTNSWIGDARAAVTPPADTMDIYRFCQAISPATNAVKLTMVAVGPGGTAPINNMSLLFTNGQTLKIQGIPTPPMYEGNPTNYFVRWVGSANAIVANNTEAETTVRLTGDALLVAYFATNQNSYLVNFVTEGNGGLGTDPFSSDTTNSLTQVVPAGGDCSPVFAAADPGYAFAGWGGDYPAAANPLTVTNVHMDTTVIAFFWPAPPTLAAHRVGSVINLTWPARTVGYVLESAGNVAGGPWTAVPNVTTNSVTLPISSTNQFFRLSATANQPN